MLTQRARYGLKALLYLASLGEAAEAPIATIAEAIDAPRKFLEAILNELRTRGVVASRRGATGGYRLAHPASDTSFADVIRALDGPLALAPCASRTAYRACDDCEDVETCQIRPVLLAARDALADVLEGSMLTPPKKAKRTLPKRK